MPYLVILTQDCDLESDSRNHDDLFKLLGEDCIPPEDDKENKKKSHDKFLHSILVCPAYPAKQLKKGTHLKGLGLEMQKIDSSTVEFHKKQSKPKISLFKKRCRFTNP